MSGIKRTNDGVEDETKKSQASLQVFMQGYAERETNNLLILRDLSWFTCMGREDGKWRAQNSKPLDPAKTIQDPAPSKQ